MTNKRVQRASLLLLAALPAAVVAAAWFIHRWHKLGGEWAYFFGALGDLFALIGLPLLVVMVVLGARLAVVERLFGLDRMLRAHKLLAKAVVSLFLAHALLQTLKFSMKLEEGWQWPYLFSMSLADWPMVLGRLALASLLVLAALALLGQWVVPFRIWKSAHLLLYPALAAGFVHAKLRGDDIARFPYNVVWYVLAAALVLVFLYRVIYRIRRGRRFTWLVGQVVPETHDTTTLVLLRAEGSGGFLWRRPGQFATIRIKRALGWGEPHPFTISGEPSTKEELRFTIKRAGEFTASIPSLLPGTPALCEGPYGVFCPDFEREKNVVMIAGGVGATPFLSAIRHASRVAPDVRVTLIWNNKTRSDITAADELDGLAASMWLKVVHVLSREGEGVVVGTGGSSEGDGSTGVFYERGHVTAEVLRKHVDPDSASFYLCGPPEMQQFVLTQLNGAFGIRARQVKRELFFW